jgi:hypothetical protein
MDTETTLAACEKYVAEVKAERATTSDPVMRDRLDATIEHMNAMIARLKEPVAAAPEGTE